MVGFAKSFKTVEMAALERKCFGPRSIEALPSIVLNDECPSATASRVRHEFEFGPNFIARRGGVPAVRCVFHRRGAGSSPRGENHKKCKCKQEADSMGLHKDLSDG